MQSSCLLLIIISGIASIWLDAMHALLPRAHRERVQVLESPVKIYFKLKVFTTDGTAFIDTMEGLPSHPGVHWIADK